MRSTWHVNLQKMYNVSDLDIARQLSIPLPTFTRRKRTADPMAGSPVYVDAIRVLRVLRSVGRAFLGPILCPTLPGEEEYDSWSEQTPHLLDEWQCSDVVKKQRIAESLKGPAADIVRGLRVTNPSATANEYLKALETAFGTTDSAADLMVKFRNTFQQETEKLSGYLLRLDKLLHAVHRKGGIDVTDMNRTRIEQIARGALTHDLAALRIRMTYKLNPAPSFTELLRETQP
ncbi:paraneoplastic antigen Ma1-like [Phyllopteryx taeniolatus]|uniref:paraneoplastic antigen Ma1-like n=1 Tax=Phyllopteryx taeniolatus TaxID=161469 RepID=UPI002AD36051|nr:paraneoplastic antigen Ma1-like [Phyllopteryx taeniolatus]